MRGLFAAVSIIVGTAAFAAQPRERGPEREYKTTLAIDHPAIEYETRPVHDRVAALAADLARGAIELPARTDALGHLPALLDRLGVSHDAQMLVFSKTSFQATKIAPDHPRAIYFNDEVAIGYVPGGASLELAAIDPVQGPVFYAMSVDAAGTPTFSRSAACLRCHLGPNTAGVPGIYVGSVIPGPTGLPLRDESAIITDHTSDFAERWGGWYVTATRGQQRDRANAVASNPADPSALVRESRQNLTSLIGRFNPSDYLAQTSDIVALMTFEHQTQMTNLITRVGWQARMVQHTGGTDERASLALDKEIEDLVVYMLFSDEARLAEPIEGVSSFTKTFPKRGPRDTKGRSLRDFDLRTRLFRYPLSYMIYSDAFDALPVSVRQRVYSRLHEILSGKERGAKFAHLSRDDRRAIREILEETKPTAVPRRPVYAPRSGAKRDSAAAKRSLWSCISRRPEAELRC